MEAKKKMESIQEELKEKEEDLEDLELTNQALIVKERKSNDELQEARKELINGLKEHQKKYSEEGAPEKALKLWWWRAAGDSMLNI